MLSPMVWLKAHPKGAAIAGVGGLAGVVLLKRRASSTNAGGQSTDGAAGSATAAGQMGTGVYDSTANDVYSSLEPAIEGLYGQISQLQDQIGTGVTPLQHTPATLPPGLVERKGPVDMTKLPTKKTTPKPKPKAPKRKPPAKKTTASRHVPKVHTPAGKSTTKHPAGVTTHKPTAKPTRHKTKPKKTPKPQHGAPKKNPPKTLAGILGFGLPKPKPRSGGGGTTARRMMQ